MGSEPASSGRSNPNPEPDRNPDIKPDPDPVPDTNPDTKPKPNQDFERKIAFQPGSRSQSKPPRNTTISLLTADNCMVSIDPTMPANTESTMLSDSGAELWLGAIPVSIWLVDSLICAAAQSPATLIRTLWSHRERLAGLQQDRGHQLGTLLGAVKWEDKRDKGHEVVIVLETQNSSETKPGAGKSGVQEWERRRELRLLPEASALAEISGKEDVGRTQRQQQGDCAGSKGEQRAQRVGNREEPQ
ncbi:hypothetical protein EK904_001975 [Melospiza melodia maxima]|nr:hypothetical protein EK904_001975 [Melospiza melodia maxima]